MFRPWIWMMSLIVALALLLPVSARAQMGEPEHGVDRPGQDLRSFTTSGWQACSTSCATERECRAYTFVNETSTCWMKSGVPGSRPGNGMVSGVRLMGWIERGVDRPGRDLRPSFASADPPACQRACKLDASCEAWTWVKPSPQVGGDGACWLKSSAPAPVNNDCCFSGVRLLPNSTRTPRAAIASGAASAAATDAAAEVGRPGVTTAPVTPSDPIVTAGAMQSTFFEVQTGAGDFEQWVAEHTINQPRTLRFRWWTDNPTVYRARWRITRTFPGDNVKVYKTGWLPKAPAKGTFDTVDIKVPPSDDAGWGTYEVTLIPISLIAATGGNVDGTPTSVAIHHSRPPDVPSLEVSRAIISIDEIQMLDDSDTGSKGEMEFCIWLEYAGRTSNRVLYRGLMGTDDVFRPEFTFVLDPPMPSNVIVRVQGQDNDDPTGYMGRPVSFWMLREADDFSQNDVCLTSDEYEQRAYGETGLRLPPGAAELSKRSFPSFVAYPIRDSELLFRVSGTYEIIP